MGGKYPTQSKCHRVRRLFSSQIKKVHFLTLAIPKEFTHCKCDWTNTGEKQGLSQQFIELDLKIIGPKLDWSFHSLLKDNAPIYAG